MNNSDLESAISGGADAVGFIVEITGSRHKISAEAARDLITKVPVFIKSVAVIAPNSVDEAAALAHETRADLLQILGPLGMKDIAALKARVSQKIIAAVPAGSNNINNIRSMSMAADAVLLDTFKDGKLGGTGATHDWNMSASISRDLKVPVILAGGLNPANVAEAIKIVRPYAVDVSSGVETEGRKDFQKVAAFVKEVRSCL
ncbi:MAG: phosphoribosylanthranilate isomerase [Methanotrichaceae archaeon]